MVTCTGDGANGDHCCYIEGAVCEFLNQDTIRCTVWDQMPFPEWETAPVGRFFARLYPGFTCRDWPQNIPEAMAGTGRCCWERD